MAGSVLLALDQHTPIPQSLPTIQQASCVMRSSKVDRDFPVHSEQAWHLGETPDQCWEHKWYLNAARKGSECVPVPNCKGGTCWWNTSHTRKLSCWEQEQKQGLRVGCLGGTLLQWVLAVLHMPQTHPALPLPFLPLLQKHQVSTNSQRAAEQSGSPSVLMEGYSAGGDCELLNQWTPPTFHKCLQQVALIKTLQKKRKAQWKIILQYPFYNTCQKMLST